MCPIDCRHVLTQIELYLDGELEVSLHAEVHDHLGTCSDCADRSEFQRRLKAMLRAKCGCDEVPAALLKRVHAILREAPPTSR
ncbi:MAG TPA: mycothiol system anti-sigma-R factor [Actinomycetota bacterium]